MSSYMFDEIAVEIPILILILALAAEETISCLHSCWFPAR